MTERCPMRGAAWSTTRSTYGVPLATRWPTSPALGSSSGQGNSLSRGPTTARWRPPIIGTTSCAGCPGCRSNKCKIVVLRYYADQSEASVADALGISIGTVKSAASRGLASLRQHAHAEAEAVTVTLNASSSTDGSLR